MCGIAGEFVLRPEGAVELENIVPMISILAHRGPDEWGYRLWGEETDANFRERRLCRLL